MRSLLMIAESRPPTTFLQSLSNSEPTELLAGGRAGRWNPGEITAVRNATRSAGVTAIEPTEGVVIPVTPTGTGR